MSDLNDNKEKIPAGPNAPKEIKDVNTQEQQKSDPQITELNNFFRNQDDLEPKDQQSRESR